MIDLDPYLSRWACPTAATAWTEKAATETASAIATATGLGTEWEPGDEGWIGLTSAHTSHGIISTLFPLALLESSIGHVARTLRHDLTVVEVTETVTDQLRAGPELLRATLLRYGWETDFNPDGFCVHDLFVESI